MLYVLHILKYQGFTGLAIKYGHDLLVEKRATWQLVSETQCLNGLYLIFRLHRNPNRFEVKERLFLLLSSSRKEQDRSARTKYIVYVPCIDDAILDRKDKVGGTDDKFYSVL